MKTLKQTPFFPLPPSRPLPPSLPPVPDTSQTSKVPPFRSRRGRKNCYGAYKPESRQIPVRRAADRTLFFLAALLAPDSKRKPQVTGIGALSDPCRLQGEGRGGWILELPTGPFPECVDPVRGKQGPLLPTSSPQEDRQVTPQVTPHPRAPPALLWTLPGTPRRSLGTPFSNPPRPVCPLSR